MKSSLTYQLLLYLGSYYFAFYFIIEFLLILYKSIVLPYPGGNLAAEIILLLLLLLTEVCRLYAGWKGNLTEASVSVLVSVLLLVPSVLGVIYVLLWQTYVLRVEVILCSLQLTLQGLQLIFGLVCALTFSKSGY